MGCNTSTTASDPSHTISLANPHNKKTLVIVGASIAGFTVGEYLWNDYNVVFVDQRDYFEYNPTSIKNAVDKEWVDTITIKYSDVVTGHGNKFQYIQATLVNVDKEGNTIEVKPAQGPKNQKLAYDVLLLATGFLYDAPVKQDGVFTLLDRKKGLHAFYDQVQAAKNIAVVGGGVVGVELAGELAFLPNASEKKIHLIVRGDKILKQVSPAAGTAAEEVLKKHKVNIHYNTEYTEAVKK